MKLSKIYDEVVTRDAWAQLEQVLNETTLLEEGANSLTDLIGGADKFIFPAFGIDKSDGNTYFIAGSARLYLYPGLVEFINKMTEETGGDEVPTTPGDLDVIVLNKGGTWETLKNNMKGKNVDMDHFNNDFSKGIYRPGGDNGLGLTEMDIEAFDKWLPQIANPKEKNSNPPDNTEAIAKRATEFNGYYFMSLYDVIDYKFNLNRAKEKKIADLIQSYIDKGAMKERGRTLDQVFAIIARIIKMNVSKIV
jgi:hypothetical protein